MIDLTRLIHQYHSLYTDKINPYEWDANKATKILEWCNKARSKILMETHFNSYNQNSDYARILILEAISRRILTEIAPKRIQKGKKKYGQK